MQYIYIYIAYNFISIFYTGSVLFVLYKSVRARYNINQVEESHAIFSARTHGFFQFITL